MNVDSNINLSDYLDLNSLIKPIELSISDIINSTPAIKEDFTSNTPIQIQIDFHEFAKTFLTTNLTKIGASIEFITPPKKEILQLKNTFIRNDLDKSVFSWELTKGIQKDIQKDGQRKNNSIVIYAAASQFNGCEAPDKFTVLPGEAVKVYQHDHTQGPQAQLQFSKDQVELINCAGNYGFNGLCKVLSENTKDAIAHGYLTPTSKNIDEVISQLQNNGHQLEYSCVANTPTQGTQPVHLVLVAAPAFGLYAIDNECDHNKEEEVQFLCALHSFRAQFNHVLTLSKTHQKPVVFKPVAVGLGVFENNPLVIAKAFYAAAKEVENELVQNNIKVRFQIFNGMGLGRQMADYLNLSQFGQPVQSSNLASILKRFF